MSLLTLIVSIAFGLLLIAGGIAHFAKPQLSDGMIPDVLPKKAVHIFTGIIEIGIGILLLFPEYRLLGLWAFGLLMLAFLPIHLIDYGRTRPIIGSHKVAAIRIAIQLVLIGVAFWLVYQNAG